MYPRRPQRLPPGKSPGEAGETKSLARILDSPSILVCLSFRAKFQGFVDYDSRTISTADHNPSFPHIRAKSLPRSVLAATVRARGVGKMELIGDSGQTRETEQASGGEEEADERMTGSTYTIKVFGEIWLSRPGKGSPVFL